MIQVSLLLLLPILFLFISLEDTKETPEGQGAGGGLDDDDVWGDVEDVSKSKI